MRFSSTVSERLYDRHRACVARCHLPRGYSSPTHDTLRGFRSDTCQNIDSEPSQHLGRASAIPRVLSQETSRKSRSTRHFSGGMQLVLDAIGACTTRLTSNSSET